MKEDDMTLPMPPGVLICEHAKPSNDDVAEMWRFKEYLDDVAARGQDAVIRDPKWTKYLGLEGVVLKKPLQERDSRHETSEDSAR